MSLRGPVATGMETASRVPDIYQLTLLEKSAARFVRVLSEVRKDVRRLISTEYKSQERRPRGQTTTINKAGGYLATDTDLVVADSTIFSKGDLIEFTRAREMGRITDITVSSNTITVTRGVGSTAAALNNADEVFRIGRVENEGYTVGASFVTDTTQLTNYIFTLSTPVEWTNYQSKEASYLSDSQKQSRMKQDELAMGIEHLREFDKNLMFSRKSKTTDGNSKNLYTTQGFWPSITTHVFDHSGGTAITEAQWQRNVLEPAWISNAAPTKWGFASNVVLTILDGFGRSYYHTYDNEGQALGFEVSEYRTSRGTLKIVHYPHLDASTYYNEAIGIADMSFLRLAIYEDTQYQQSMQPKNVKSVQNEWCTYAGLDIEYEEAHATSRDLRTAA